MIIKSTNVDHNSLTNLAVGDAHTQYVRVSQVASSQTIGLTGSRLTKLWATDIEITNPLIIGSGGLGVSTLALNGILYGNGASAVGVTAIGAEGQILRAGATPFVPAWTTATYPTTTTANQLLYSSATNVIGGLTSGNSGVLVTSGAGVPSIATDIPTAVTIGSGYIYRAGGTDIPVLDGGTGTSTGSITGTGALTFAAGGTAQNVTLTPSTTGYTILNGNVGIGTTGPVSLTEIQGGLTTTGAILTLSSKETSTVANDVLGRINFRAALDASGGDAILTGASIVARAEGTFSASNNATSLDFQTGASEVATTKMTIMSSGNVGIGTTEPDNKLTLLQKNDNNGLKIYGYDDMSSSYGGINIDGGGDTNVFASSGDALEFFVGVTKAMTIQETTVKPHIPFVMSDDVTLNFGDGKDYGIGYHFASDSLQIVDGSTINTNVRIAISPSTGNVGIGTTSPGYKLHVVGDAFLLGDDGWNGAGDLATLFLGSPANGVSSKWGGPDLIFSVFKNGGGGSLGANSLDAMVIAQASGHVGIGTAGPVSLGEFQGGLTTVGSVLTLGTKEPTVVANDVLGRLNFYAPLEAAGGDALLNGASIVAIAEDTFSATVNKTSLHFQTGASETATTRMTINSAGAVDVIGAFTGGTIQADNGFTGTGAYTNFTIVGGIITAAS